MQDISSKIQTRGYYSSSSFKMALLFTVLLGLSVAVLYYVVRDMGQERFDSAMQKAIVSEFHYLEPALESGRVPPEITGKVSMPGRVYMLADQGGNYLLGDKLPLTAAAARQPVRVLLPGGRDYMVKTHILPDGRRLTVGVDITEELAGYGRMQALSFAAVVLMALVIFTSFLISIFVVSRTNRIAQTARSIMGTGNLSQRIEVDSRWDDLSNMARVLNELLARVEELLQGVQNVSNNIAHDLRTPLTRLRNNLERLRDDGVVAAEPRTLALCEAMIGEADRLLEIFSALLRIARIETGKERHTFTTIALDVLLQDVIDFYEPLAEEKKIALLVDIQPAIASGDRDLLFQAFANVLDNAIKFSPAGGRVEISLAPAPLDTVICRIRDTGPGIPQAEQEKVFERFYRGDSSRNTAGSGLGLSLVGVVVRLHGGDITLAQAEPGLSLSIALKNNDL